MSNPRINKIFQKATRKALVGWESDIDGVELVNELWAWYLERPYVQKKFEELSEAKLVSFARRQAINLLSQEAKDRDLFQARTIYSSDAVKAALSGKLKSGYLASILPIAWDVLDKKNHGQAEALRSRYLDGAVPAASTAEAAKLKRAVKAITQHVNIIALTSGDGNGKPKLRKPVDPDIRRHNLHSDPTASIALALMDNPELRDEYLHEEPITEYLKGRRA